MRKYLLNSLFAASCIFAISMSAGHGFAQDAAPAQQDQARPNQQRGLDALAQRLSLTDQQKSQLQPIFQERRQKMQDLRASGASQEQQRTEMKKIMDDSDAKIQPILTPDQWQQYQQMQAQMREHRQQHQRPEQQ